MRAERPPRTCRTPERSLAALCLSAFALLGGCGVWRYFPPGKLAYPKLAAPYRMTQLKVSTTLDVLNLMREPPVPLDPTAIGKQILSQNDTTIALSGQSEDGLKMWVNMVVFDEYRMTAKRKYFFCSDEAATIAPTDPDYHLVPPRRGLLFDSRFTLDPNLVTTPFATEEAKHLAIVRELAERVASDVRQIAAGEGGPVPSSDEMVAISGMMMNQVFRGILIELEKSPGLAKDLGNAEGVEFPHISLNKGRIQMLVQDDIATVKIRVNLPMVAPGLF